MKCGGGGSCLPIDSADCGNGTSCPADSVCKRGGGCITRQDLTQLKADDLARKQAAEADRKAAELKRIEDAKEVARLKEEERQRVIAQQKADAEAKKAEQARLQEEARAAALKKIEDDKAAAQAKAAERKRLRDEAQAAALEAARVGKAAQQLVAQLKIEQAARAKTGQSGSANMTNAAAGAPGSVSSGKVDIATLQKMANDPSELPVVRNLAASLLVSEYGSTPKTGTAAGNASAAARASTSPLSGNYILQAILNDPSQSLASRKIAATGLGLDPTKIAQGTSQGGAGVLTGASGPKSNSKVPCETADQILANLGNGKNDSSPICPAGNAGAPAAAVNQNPAGAAESSGQALKLNADVKTDIVTLSPTGSMVALPDASATVASNKISSVASVGAPSTFISPVALGASTLVGGAIGATSPTQAPDLWNRIGNAYTYANAMADNDPNFTRGAADINGTIKAIEGGVKAGWAIGGPDGAIAGAIVGAKINGVMGNVQEAKSIFGDIAQGNASGAIREAVVVGEDKVVDKGSDMLFNAATAGAGVASPISLASAMRVDASWGTYFLVGFFNSSSGR